MDSCADENKMKLSVDRLYLLSFASCRVSAMSSGTIHWQKQQEKPTNCGTEVTDVSGKLQCKSTEYLWCICNHCDFATPISSQSVAVFATVWPYFKGGVSRSQFCDVRGVLGVRICTNRNFVIVNICTMTSQCLSIRSFALSATVWPEFQCQIIPHQLQPTPLPV